MKVKSFYRVYEITGTEGLPLHPVTYVLLLATYEKFTSKKEAVIWIGQKGEQSVSYTPVEVFEK